MAVPFSLLAERRTVRVSLAGLTLVVRLAAGRRLRARRRTGRRRPRRRGSVRDHNGRPVPFTEPFWFAVAAFRADVRIVNGE